MDGLTVTGQLPAGTRVSVTVPVSSGPVRLTSRAIGRATRETVRVWSGAVVGPVPYEPGMTRVRPDGASCAVRVLTEYLTAIPAEVPADGARRPACEAGYAKARESYGDSYADYLMRHDAALIAKGIAPTPWPQSLAGNDGD